MEGLLSTGPTPSSLTVNRHWDIYRPVELRKDCKFSEMFMYLKRVPASFGRAVLRCGFSGGLVQRGVALLVLLCPFFSELQVK